MLINIRFCTHNYKIFNSMILFILIIISYKYLKKKNIKICLCAIGKNENSYVKEYIKHYKELGYSHIYIYDNNDINGQNFSFILNEEINNGFVSIIDYIGYKGKNNNSQREAYYDCYKNNRRHYHWLSFFDFDEFLVLKNKTIQEFFNNEIFNNCQVIKINWLVYESNKEVLYYEEKPLQERFNVPSFNNIANKHIKSTVKGNLKYNYWQHWANPHSSFNNYIACSSSGKKIDSSTPFLEPPDYSNAYLKHFGMKSFEEFCFKLKRGWPDATNNMIWINSLIKGNINNLVKLKIIKNIFNLTNI